MSLDKNGRKYIAPNDYDLSLIFNSKGSRPGLLGGDEKFYTSSVVLENISSVLLAHIAIKTKNQDTLNKALHHPKIIVDWITILESEDIVMNKLLFDNVIDELMNQFDEIKKQDYDYFLTLCVFIVNTALNYDLGKEKNRLYAELIKKVLKHIEGYFNSQNLNKLNENFSWRSIEKSSIFAWCVTCLEFISKNPHSSIEMSNKAIALMEELEKLCENNSILGKNKFSFKQTLEKIDFYNPWGYFRFGLLKPDSYSANSGAREISRHNYQAGANLLLHGMLKYKDFKFDKNKNQVDVVVYFILDNNTTYEMIKKVFLDRLNGFYNYVDKDGKIEIQLDDRIDTIFEKMVQLSGGFEKKDLPYELLTEMYRLTSKESVKAACAKKIKSGNFLIDLAFIRNLDSNIGSLVEFGFSKDFCVEIAEKCQTVGILRQILIRGVFGGYPRECIDIIWNRRNEFANKLIDEPGSLEYQILTIYNGMLECRYAAKDMLSESIVGLGHYFNILIHGPIILNPNFDEDIYKLFDDSINKYGPGFRFLDNKFKTMLYNAADNLFNFIRDMDKDEDFIYRKVLLDRHICSIIFDCIYCDEPVDENVVIKFLSLFESKDEYIAAYQRLIQYKQKNKGDSHGKK